MESVKILNEQLKIAVHLHIYYFEMWDEIKGYLLNIGKYPYHLYVTLTKNNPQIIDDILQFHKDSTIFIVENKGYDVGPFIYFLHKINLNDYDIIIKLHTKNKTGCDTIINHQCISRKYWSELLFEGVLGSKILFKKNLKAFKEQPDLGMIASKYLITSNLKNSIEVKTGVQYVIKQLVNNPPKCITFVAGTMFMIRSPILKQIKDTFNFDDFAPTDGRIKDGTLAHILERVFGCLVIAKGYKIKGFDKNYNFIIDRTILKIKRFLYQKKITKSNHIIIKICKIPFFHKKLI